ncbi:uncharacterized protein J7T54_002691 [Emericellopsis cladophorae]|uniref:Uncharacterized protein n=1 Tax=Emericellopsis cladophorae TaxID=2686198 RepID=A0A9Q0BB98_9HYPO|nr:uncharacterized protein J7T54_002691 [Emericellopsis cladophorae]KAI6777829.1 hypothetical protein J7T54_002691 [Emericellopsis cladophorae]
MTELPSGCPPSWRKEGENTYRQSYGFQEALYNAISAPPGSPALFLVASGVTFKHVAGKNGGLDLVYQLRRAWVQMRYQYPGLAAENLSDGKFYQSPLTPEQQQHWLDTTFLVLPGRKMSEQWRDMVKPRQMTLNYLPEEQELFLQGEHHTLDGRGFMSFWDRFFQFLASPVQVDLPLIDGSEIARLPFRSDDLLDVAESRPGRGEQRAQEILAPLADLETPICVPVSQPLLPHCLRNSAERLKVSAILSKAIIDACKAQNLSVTASWHAAVIHATQIVQRQRNAGTDRPNGTKFATFGNFDLRRYFPSTSDSEAYSVGNHHCVLPCVVEPGGKTFAQIAKEVSRFYQQDVPREDPEVWSAMGPMVRTLLPEFVQRQLQETTPAVSSLGPVDSFIRSSYGHSAEHASWTIRDVWFGDTVTGPWLECFLWSWQGRICLNTCYNSAYYAYTDVDDFNQLVLEEMMVGLGVRLQGFIGKL